MGNAVSLLVEIESLVYFWEVSVHYHLEFYLDSVPSVLFGYSFCRNVAFHTPFVVLDLNSLLIKQIRCFNMVLQVLIRAIFPTAGCYFTPFFLTFLFKKLRKLPSRRFYFICSV